MGQAPISAASADSTTQPKQVPCPRCKEPLIDPKGLGWCRACGFCLSLAETEKKVVLPSRPAQPNQLSATGEAVLFLPVWFWVMSLGVVAIAGVTFCAGRYFVLAPLDRAVLTLVQIGTGLLVMFVGQFIGLLRIAPDVETLTFKDAVIPIRLYGLALKRLPATQLTVYCGSWGLTMIVAALVFIGGLSHLFSYLPNSQQKNKSNQVQKVQSAR